MQLMRWLAVWICLIAIGSAQERLTPRTPEIQTVARFWQVAGIHLDMRAPNIEVTLISDEGTQFVWRYTVTETVTAADVRAVLQSINRGEFITNDKQTLNRWLLERIVASGEKTGTITN